MYYVGLDLGQKQDHSAIAVVEDEFRGPGLTVRHVERVPLGTKYPAVVERVRALVWEDEMRRMGCGVAVDATGVGAPVVDLLWAAALGCEVAAVTITGGGQESKRRPGEWSVPKRDLMAGVQVGLEQGELRIAKGLRETGVLVEELLDLRMTVRATGRVRVGADGAGEHDDLAMAVALAVWMARRPKPGLNNFCGKIRLPGH
jgi:phage FluMu gp28-like protein